MATPSEDVHAPIWHHPRELKTDVERAKAVVHTPDDKQFSFELRQVGAEILAWHLALFLAEQFDRFGIDAGLVALLENVVGQEGWVVENCLQEIAKLLTAWAAALVVARDHFDALHRERCEDRC